MKDKKGITITIGFQKKLKEANRKPNKIWVDKGNKFGNRTIKSWLEKKSIETYSTHNEEESADTERFIRIFNIKKSLY